MSDILCLEDVPFQCNQCKSLFPSENSLKLHCFMEDHKLVLNRFGNEQCTCNLNKMGPHHCASCKLIAVSLDGERSIRNAASQVYTRSQLWKCSNCGMLWKCIDCGVLFRGSNMFRQHMPHCQNVQETLKRMKSEKCSDEEASDTKGNIPVKEEKFDVKHRIKQEPIDNKIEFNKDFKYPVKQEPVDNDIEYQVNYEVNASIKEECNVDCKSYIKQEVDEDSEGNQRKGRISLKRTSHGNYNLRGTKK